MKKKRAMPAHIVLPSGMWRFIKGKKKAHSSPRRAKKRKLKRAGGFVARHKKHYSRKGSGKNPIMKGLFPMAKYVGGGLLGGLLVGAGVAMIADKIPIAIPYKKYTLAAVVGGAPAIGGVFLKEALFKQGTGSGAFGAVY